MVSCGSKGPGEVAKEQVGAILSIGDGSCELLSEEISEDGKTAKVVLKETVGGKETEETINMKLNDKGDWELDFGF